MYNTLIVDDSATMRSIIKKALNIANLPIAQIFEAKNGQDAIEILENNKVELIFLDINMPVMDGLEFIDWICNSIWKNKVKIVVISSEGSMPRINYIKDKGKITYLKKPFQPEKLRDLVNFVMEGG